MEYSSHFLQQRWLSDENKIFWGQNAVPWNFTLDFKLLRIAVNFSEMVLPRRELKMHYILFQNQ